MSHTFRPVFHCAGTVVAAAIVCGSAQAEPAPLWSPHIDLEAKPGSKRSLGEADLFLPISQDARTLVFANLRARLDDDDNHEGNLGLGWRHMHESGWNLGAYGFFDRRRTDNDNYFNQATLGAEALGRDWDIRANGYLPIGTKAYDLGSSSSAALSGAAIQVTTITQEERALKGFDAELGWRTPIFDSEAARQLRFYVGGYRFSDAGLTVEGPRLRAELALDDLSWFGKGTRLYLGAEAQHDNPRGTQSFVSVRLRIPLGKESASSRTLTAQERRMTAPVMRDVDIVTQSRVNSTLVENATQTSDGQVIAVVSSATTTGAALQAALNTAGADSMVILSGTFATTGNTTLLSGQTVMGAGSVTVRSPTGRTATLTQSIGATISSTATVGPGGTEAAVTMANYSTLTGMMIQQVSGGNNVLFGVQAENVTGAVIANNTITATTGVNGVSGIRVEGASSNVTVSGNRVTVENTHGNGTAVGMYLQGTSITVANNTLSVNAYGSANEWSFYRVGPLSIISSTGNMLTRANPTPCGIGGGAGTGTIYYTTSTGTASGC